MRRRLAALAAEAGLDESRTGDAALAARVIGWAFAIWGTALYWWAAVLYLEQTRRLARAAQGQPGGGGDAGHDPGPAAVK